MCMSDVVLNFVADVGLTRNARKLWRVTQCQVECGGCFFLGGRESHVRGGSLGFRWCALGDGLQPLRSGPFVEKERDSASTPPAAWFVGGQASICFFVTVRRRCFFFFGGLTRPQAF